MAAKRIRRTRSVRRLGVRQPRPRKDTGLIHSKGRAKAILSPFQSSYAPTGTSDGIYFSDGNSFSGPGL